MAGAWSTPTGDVHTLAASPSGTLAVFDGQGIDVFTADGKLIKRFGSRGTDAGQIGGSLTLAVSDTGAVGIADESNHRVAFYAADGRLTAEWGPPADVTADDWPSGIAFGAGGSIWTTDRGGLAQFSAAGEEMTRIKVASLRAPIGLSLLGPSGFVVSDGNAYWVISQTGAAMLYGGAAAGFAEEEPLAAPSVVHGDQVLVANRQGRVTTWSGQGRLLAGCSQAPLPGRYVGELVSASRSVVFTSDGHTIRRVHLGDRSPRGCDNIAPSIRNLRVRRTLGHLTLSGSASEALTATITVRGSRVARKRLAGGRFHISIGRVRPDSHLPLTVATTDRAGNHGRSLRRRAPDMGS